MEKYHLPLPLISSNYSSALSSRTQYAQRHLTDILPCKSDSYISSLNVTIIQFAREIKHEGMLNTIVLLKRNVREKNPANFYYQFSNQNHLQSLPIVTPLRKTLVFTRSH